MTHTHQRYSAALVLLSLFICPLASHGQTTTIVNPNGAGGFELGTTWAANGWTVVNGTNATNRWFVGTAATGLTGVNCAYVGTGANNNNYDPLAISVNHFYRDVAIPAGQSNVTLNFSWKGYGESTFDYIRVYVVPTTTAPVVGTLLTSGQIGGDYNLSSTWQNATITLPTNLAGTTQRLVFTWRNDGSVGTNPAGAIDNVSLVSTSNAPSCSQLLGTGFVTVPSLPYNSGSGTTCGSGNDLTSTNTNACGSTSYLDGEDRAWAFTPSASGQISIDLNAPSASYTGLMLYQGCPLTSSGNGVCISQSQSSSGSKTLCVTVTANITYYLILDSWPSPTCNAYNNLSISSPSGGAQSCSSLLGTGFTNVASLPYSSGSGTTCGQINDLTPANTAACGSTLYLDGEDRVWAFTPTSSGQVTINLDAPNATWTGLMLYQGCPVSAPCSGPSTATCIIQSQSSTGSKSICVTVTAGVTYYLILDSYPSPTCNAYNNLSISAPSTGGGASCASLLGNGFTNVTSLPYNSGSGTTCGFGNELTSTNTATCGATYYLDGEDQVWAFTPTTTGQITIDLNAPSASYTGLMLYQGCPTAGPCGGVSSAICIAQSQSFAGSKSFCVNVTANVTYYLVLDSWPAPACNPYTNLFISAVTTGAVGTVCSNAISIASLPYSVSNQTTACAGNDYTPSTPGICNSTFTAGDDRVYSFSVSSPQCIGVTITGASSNDIGFYIYQGCPGAAGAVCIGSGGGATLGTLSGTVTLPAAGSYYIIIDSQAPTTSVTYGLQVTSFGSGAPNDRPFQAVAIPFNITTPGNNSCSGNTDEPGQPSCFGPVGANTLNTVWYSFVAPASSCVKMRTGLGTLTNTQIAVYGPVNGSVAAGAGSTLPFLACNDDLPPCGSNTYPTSLVELTGLTPGMTYYISVDGYGGQTGSFTLFVMDSGTGGALPFPPTPGQDCSVSFPVCDANISVPNPGPQAVGSSCEFGSGINCLASGERGSYWYRLNIANNGFLEFDIVPNDWPGAPSTTATDYDFAVWQTRTAGTPGPANCNNLASVPPISCNYSFLGVTGCFSATAGTAPAAYPGFGGAYQPRIPVSAGDEYLIIVSNFTNSTSGFTLNFSTATPLASNPPTGGTLVWTGSLNNDWYNPENWGGCAIPKCTYNVAIPPVAIQPSITGATATVGSIDISAGATLTLQTGAQLKVCNNFINNGAIVAQSGSTLVLQSDSIVQNQYMTGSMTGSNRLWNVVINKPSNVNGNTVFLNNDLDNAGDFIVGSSASYAGGVFSALNRIHRVGGNFSVYYSTTPYATYDATGNTLEFNGTIAQNYFNRGALHNVVMNHTGPGLTLGNSGVTDWMVITGNLTLNQGKIITSAANRVNVLNSAPAAVNQGATTSFVDGNLRRSFASTGGSYDFPVGSTTKGYQRINFNFPSGNDRTYAIASFANAAPATPSPALGPECLYSTYDQAPLNNGYWLVSAVPATGIATFNATAYPTNYSNAALGYTLMRRATGTSAWGLEGTCVFPGPITAIQRNGMTTLGTNTGFSVAQSLSPLPVSLLDFRATPAENKILINWSTASETNNAGFHLEKSVQGDSFGQIGWIPGHGNTNTQHDYLLEDWEVEKNKTYYYRLNQMDFDGTSSYSDVVSARLSGQGVQVSAWPNPFNSSTNLIINLQQDAFVEAWVINAIGQEVAELTRQELTKGSHPFNFDLQANNCKPGVYTVMVKVGEEMFRLRIVAYNR
ncbi:MAG: hypothetical protein ACU4F9_05725 [Arcticibacter sp.]